MRGDDCDDTDERDEFGWSGTFRDNANSTCDGCSVRNKRSDGHGDADLDPHGYPDVKSCDYADSDPRGPIGNRSADEHSDGRSAHCSG